MTEHLLDQVLALARYTGWRVMHQRPARTTRGWRTTIAGDAGYPDITLAHTNRSTPVFLELKGPTGYPSADQLRWLQALGPLAALVRPRDWAYIQARLASPTGTPLKVPSLIWQDGTWHGTLAAWATKKSAAA